MNRPSFRFKTLLMPVIALALTLGTLVGPGIVRADEKEDQEKAESGALAMSRGFEDEGFVFRSEPWISSLPKNVGKAVKVQLFKGNDYRFVIAVPAKSGVKLTGAVLDFGGHPVGEIQPLLAGWGIVLSYKPVKTGVYVVSIRQTEDSKGKDSAVAMFTGYK